MNLLLILLTFWVAILAIFVGGIYKHMIILSRKGQSATGLHFKKAEIEELLATRKTLSAKNVAMKWRQEQPRNPTAYLLLAQALFQLGDLIETKRVREELIEFSPESEFTAQKYLDRIQKSLKNTRPRAIE